MKHNKYIVKYTIPRHFGLSDFFVSSMTIVCNDKDDPSLFYDSMCMVCIECIKKEKGITVEPKDINFHLISLVDSVSLEETR